MEMAITGTPTAASGAAPAFAPVAPANSGGAANRGFQQTLFSRIAAEGDATQTPQTASTTPMANASSFPALADTDVMQAGPEMEELLSLIDGLIDSLDKDKDGEEIVTETRAEELAAALESLYALLALMGVPTAHLRLSAESLRPQHAQDADPAAALPAVKHGLQDALFQLQAALQQGSHKQVQGQETHALAAKQIEALAALLKGEVSTQPEDKAARAVRAESQVPAWAIAQPTGGLDAAAHLQRLTQQSAAHPIYAALAAENAAAGMASAQTGAGAAEAPQGEMAFNLPGTLITSGNAREFAPLIAQGAAGNAFVLADDFADTMQGLIMHKFDIRTLNGISEAKLVLFPEHLGQVDVRITMHNGVLTALFQTDTAMARDMLENQMAQLRAALQAQGLNVDRLEVTESQSSAQLLWQHGQGQGGNQSFGGQQGFRDEQHVTDAAFEAELAEQSAIQDMGYGRTINETA